MQRRLVVAAHAEFSQYERVLHSQKLRVIRCVAKSFVCGLEFGRRRFDYGHQKPLDF
jgi:hypothetical protein